MIVIVLMVSMVMLSLALGTLALVDTQARQSGRERVRESAFNLAEGAMAAQTFTIGSKGVGSSALPFPVCGPGTGAQKLCPDPANLTASFNQSDQADYDPVRATWSSVARDNGPPGGAPTRLYDANVAGYPAYDRNGDEQMFVRASATVKGETRTVVALVALQEQQIAFPRFTIGANFFSTTNAGNKTIVDAATSGGVELRCSGVNVTSCLDIRRPAQISGAINTSSTNGAKAITQADLDALTDYADSLGTHYTGCPTDFNGKVVVIDAGNCTINPSVGTCCNTPQAPGLLIVKNGTLALGGNTKFEGIVYMVNEQNSSSAILTLGGTSQIVGGVVVDGPGGVAAGASGLNIKFGPQAFDSVSVAGTAGVVQNTFREL